MSVRPHNDHSGSGVPPLNQENKQSRDSSATLAAPTGRKNVAQGKERSDAALGHESQSTSSPEGAKEGSALPKDWRHVAVKEMAHSIQYGHTASAIERADGPRFLRITDIQDGRVDWNAVPSCDIPVEDIPEIPPRVPAISFLRAQERPRAKASSLASAQKRFRVLLDSRSSVERMWIHVTSLLSFRAPTTGNRLNGGKRGIGQPNVNGRVLGEIRFPLAPLPEQRRIVAEIEKQFTRLEAGVTALRRVQANLKRYRAAVLKAACEGRLVPTEAELARIRVKAARRLAAEAVRGWLCYF